MSNFRSSEVIQVIMTEVCEGEGTEESPKRLVTYFTSLEGKLLAVVDSYAIRDAGVLE